MIVTNYSSTSTHQCRPTQDASLPNKWSTSYGFHWNNVSSLSSFDHNRTKPLGPIRHHHTQTTNTDDNTVFMRLYQLATTQTCTHKLHLFETLSTGRRLSQIGAHCALILAMHSTVLVRVAFPQEHHIHGSNVAGVRHVSAIAHADVVFVGRRCAVQLQADVRFRQNHTTRLEVRKDVHGQLDCHVGVFFKVCSRMWDQRVDMESGTLHAFQQFAREHEL